MMGKAPNAKQTIRRKRAIISQETISSERAIPI